MIRARSILPAADIAAARFGFHVNNSEAVNAAALRSAVVFAEGRPVTVQVPTDCVMGSVDLSNMHVNLEFVGNGRIALNGTINVSGRYEQIQNVVSATFGGVSINGSSTACTAIVVADASVYARGDVMRFVSDDFDPASRQGLGRYGEDFTIIYVDEDIDTVYLAGSLEFRASYATNMRIGRLVKYNVDIRNLNLRGVVASQLITVGPHYRPFVQMTFEDALWIALTDRGNIDGEFHVSGSFPLTGDEDDLQYGVLPRSSSRSKFVNLNIFGGRHAFTTGYGTVTAGSDALYDFGPPRDCVCINPVAISVTNAPFDDHEGARRSTFINPIARAAQRGGGVKKSAFQARGIDMMIINANVDQTFNCMLMNGVQTPVSSTTMIDGGFTASAPLGAHDSDPLNDVIPRGAVYIKGLVAKVTANKTDNGYPFQVINHPLTIEGGVFELYQTSDNTRVLSVLSGHVTTTGDPMFKCSGAINGWRFAQMAAGSRLTGDFRFDNSGHSYSGTVRMFRTSDTDCSFNVKVLQTAGSAVSMTNGGEVWVEETWIKWDDTIPPRVITP